MASLLAINWLQHERQTAMGRVFGTSYSTASRSVQLMKGDRKRGLTELNAVIFSGVEWFRFHTILRTSLKHCSTHTSICFLRKEVERVEL
jgi:hypothetical protein